MRGAKAKVRTIDSLFAYCEPEPNSGCWLWMSDRTPGDGYGIVRLAGVMTLAHRVAYRLAWGEIPADRVVMHRCDTKPCINPAHLKAGTRSENDRDAFAKGLKPRLCGDAGPAAKLTAAQVATIRERLAMQSQRSLAREFGVTRSNIYRIARRLTWR